MIDVEVLEIFPKEDLTPKEQRECQCKGNCHVKLPSLGLHIRNISYRVGLEGKISVKPPFRVYSQSKRTAFVQSVEFENGEVWKRIEEQVVNRIQTLAIYQAPQQLSFC